jgi:hypothetical protein
MPSLDKLFSQYLCNTLQAAHGWIKGAGENANIHHN